MRETSVDPLLKSIGTRLMELRKEKGFTSHETFATAFSLPRVHYWRIEKGKANCTLKTLVKILTIHNLTLSEFFASMGTTHARMIFA
jgi:transcriptional regulator with XRE-family HTH domain